MRADLDGSNLELVADVQGNGRLYSLRVDPLNELVYYGTFGGTIGTVGFDGSNPQIFTSQRGLYAFAFEYRSAVVIPEPTSLCLCLVGIAILYRGLWRRSH